MTKILLMFIFMVIGNNGFAQTIIISGKLVDEQQNAIPNVSVTYKKIEGMALLGFTKTADNGTFKLEVKITDVDSIQLDFNHMSYAKRSVRVANRTATHSYTLQTEVREIEEVKAANMPVFRRNDTINYNVDAFTSKQDRVIADIIRKLPGIEMQGDQILYQGKPIQKYMVNNLDLMEGRYAMINKNLPADAVKNVQIVENDQPIKILDSLVFSDRASLNLELKEFTTTGTGKLGAGFVPLLWDVNITPMTFGKTFQMLNSFQSNNTGNDVTKSLRAFYTGGSYLSSANASIQDGPYYIHLQNAASPGFDEKKWLDNKVFLLSTNMLKKLNNGIELKGNVSYFDDLRNRAGFTATQFFAGDQTIVNTESIDNSFRSNVLEAGALVEKNEKNIYLRNRTLYRKRWNADRGSLLFNGMDNILQRRRYTDEAFMNALSLARNIGKQLVNISSTVEYHNTPQRLAVLPGQFEDLLNQGNPYDEMQQHIDYRSFRWDNNLSMIKKINYWRFSPAVGLNYNRSDLQTFVNTHIDGNTTSPGEDYTNDMSNSELLLATRMGIFWEKSHWKFNANLPLNTSYFNVRQQGEKTLDNAIRSTFNPSGSLTYIMNTNNEWNVRISGGNQFGGLNNFYNGYIIQMYRSMQRYDARLLQSQNFSGGFGYNYKNTLKANFANFTYSYSSGSRDYILASAIDSLGRTSMSIADRESRNDNHSLSGGVSRFFSSVKTIVKLNGNTAWAQSDYLANDIMAIRKSNRYGGSLEIINNLSQIVSGEYKMTFSHSVNRFAAERSNTITQNNHYLNLIVYPHDLHSLTVSNSLYRNNLPGQRNQYFLDAVYRFQIKKWKADLELTAQNLLNNDDYVQQFISDIQFTQSSFQLRPRQILLSTSIRF